MAHSTGELRLSVGATILAAGRSSRMGHPKLLLSWGGTSILGHLIRQWRSLAAAQIAAVCAEDDQEISKELQRLRCSPGDRIINPAPEQGMFSSILCAARWPHWQSNLSHWAIVLGDQPQVRLATLRALLEFAAARPGKVCQPARGGRRHHPVVLPRAVFETLPQSPVPTLKEFLRSCDVAACELDDPGLEIDIDSPDDYLRAKDLASGAD